MGKIEDLKRQDECYEEKHKLMKKEINRLNFVLDKGENNSKKILIEKLERVEEHLKSSESKVNDKEYENKKIQELEKEKTILERCSVKYRDGCTKIQTFIKKEENLKGCNADAFEMLKMINLLLD